MPSGVPIHSRHSPVLAECVVKRISFVTIKQESKPIPKRPINSSEILPVIISRLEDCPITAKNWFISSYESPIPLSLNTIVFLPSMILGSIVIVPLLNFLSKSFLAEIASVPFWRSSRIKTSGEL